jgi:large subunit ribosomal protein L15
MRMPKRGFNNIFRRNFAIVNVGRLQTAIDAGLLDTAQTITGEVLRKAGVVRQIRDGVRLLASGELKAKLSIEVAGASKAAIAAVEKVGGTVVVPTPAVVEAKS